MDLILRNARVVGNEGVAADIGIDKGRIAVIRPRLASRGRDARPRRAARDAGVHRNAHPPRQVAHPRALQGREGRPGGGDRRGARQKKLFTAEDVYQRAKITLEKAILNGTTHMRTQLEVDPGIGLRGLEGVRPLIEEYKWAIDLEICIFPQEGLLNNPGTDELMIQALKSGGSVVGAAPYTDSSPHGQIDRIFAIAREFDIDIDMHLDFAPTPEDLDLLYVCELAERFKWGGRVAIGHVTKLSTAPPDLLAKCAKRMADAGVALTVLPSTDLYLMGRHMTHGVMRGVTEAHKLLHHGVNCTLSTNNVLNPFTPFGDCSLVRMANIYANICQVGSANDTRECFNMITTRSAKLMNLKDYGLAVGKPADLAVLDAESPSRPWPSLRRCSARSSAEGAP